MLQISQPLLRLFAFIAANKTSNSSINIEQLLVGRNEDNRTCDKIRHALENLGRLYRIWHNYRLF